MSEARQAIFSAISASKKKDALTPALTTMRPKEVPVGDGGNADSCRSQESASQGDDHRDVGGRTKSGTGVERELKSAPFNKEGDEGAMHVLPRRARLPGRQLQELFEEMAVASAATVEHIGGLHELPEAVYRYLFNNQRTGTRRLYLNHPLLAPLDWKPLIDMQELDISADAAFFDADIGITCAYCGIAETGSIVLLSEYGVSSAAYFLPGVLIVALLKDQIVPAQEAVWAKLQTAYTRLPRTVTLVTGPSRTGDIEQKLVIGAHGPVKVHMVLYDR